MEQDPITVPDTFFRERTGNRLDPRLKIGPGPGLVLPDQRGTVGKAPRRLNQKMREIGGWDQRSGSRIET